MSKIVQDHSILRQKSKPVEDVEEAKKIIAELEKALSETNNGIGLAAIQLGIPKRIGVIREKNGFVHLINPIIEETLDEFIYVNEGCLSFPNVFRDTKRFKQITVVNQKIENDKFEGEKFVAYYSPDPTEPGNSELTAIAIQHEIEHFDGGLILDHEIKRQPVEASKKIGRNDKCPCGSGKKFKKCCIDKGIY